MLYHLYNVVQCTDRCMPIVHKMHKCNQNLFLFRYHIKIVEQKRQQQRQWHPSSSPDAIFTSHLLHSGDREKCIEKSRASKTQKGPKMFSMFRFRLPFAHKYIQVIVEMTSEAFVRYTHTHTHRCYTHLYKCTHAHHPIQLHTNSQKDAISTSNFTLIKLFEFLIWAWLYCRHQCSLLFLLLSHSLCAIPQSNRVNTCKRTHWAIHIFCILIALFLWWVEFAIFISADKMNQPTNQMNEFQFDQKITENCICGTAEGCGPNSQQDGGLLWKFNDEFLFIVWIN